MTSKAEELSKILIDNGVCSAYDAYSNAANLLESGRVEVKPVPKCGQTIYISMDFLEKNTRRCELNTGHHGSHENVTPISGVPVTYTWPQ